MHCYEIQASQVLTGIPAGRYCLLDDNIVSGGRIVSAGISVEPLDGMDGDIHTFRDVLAEGSYLFGIVRFVEEASQPAGTAPEDASLIEIDMSTHACAPEYGDMSKLLTWHMHHGLFVCRPGATAFRNLRDNSIIVLTDDKPERHPDPAALRKAVGRKALARRAADHRKGFGPVRELPPPLELPA